jgi:hypothetical protein
MYFIVHRAKFQPEAVAPYLRFRIFARLLP